MNAEETGRSAVGRYPQKGEPLTKEHYVGFSGALEDALTEFEARHLVDELREQETVTFYAKVRFEITATAKGNPVDVGEYRAYLDEVHGPTP